MPKKFVLDFGMSCFFINFARKMNDMTTSITGRYLLVLLNAQSFNGSFCRPATSFF